MTTRAPKGPIAVLNTAESERPRELASVLGLPLVEKGDSLEAACLLAWANERFEFQWTRPDAPGPICVDFLAGATMRRWNNTAQLRRQPMARALGIPKGARNIIDATAGLGRDSFTLAAMDCHVLAIERNPVIAALLEDGLLRASHDPRTREIVKRLTLHVADAKEMISDLAQQHQSDAILLDPMFPVRTKSALVKKEMQLFQELLGEEEDAKELLAIARASAHRVAVKRPLHAPLLMPDADLTVKGTRLRWDVYLARPKPA